MDKLFTFAGVSTLNGVVAYRFANDAGRAKVLERNGHENIDLRPLPQPMSKEDATRWLYDNGVFAESNKVTAKQVRGRAALKAAAEGIRAARAAKTVVEAPAEDDDGFVEPTDEKIQVAMCRLARKEPNLTRWELLERVTAEIG